MTPHHLHATRTAWALHTARVRLAELAAEEAAQIAAEALEAPALLHSPAWGRRHALGGHGDPTSGMVATAERPARRNRWAEMADRCATKLQWLTTTLDVPGLTAGLDPLALLLSAVPMLQPGTARTVTQHLADEDAWIRNAIGWAPAGEHLPGVECPVCGTRSVRAYVDGPAEGWTVMCDRDTPGPCRCVGQGCRCGQDGAVEGVVHIWPRAAVITSTAA